MKILHGKRCSGKTTELIKLSHEKWLYIICKDRQRVENIINIASKMKLDIPFPITLNELPLRSHYIKEVLVDDMEDILQDIIGKSITLATTSSDITNIQNN